MRPLFHYTAKKNWINDPNGLCYYNGEYHLYYQHNPKNPYWGNMSWGHATSSNLFNWQERDVALIPSKGYDKDGCFSGSALVLEDKILYAYTGVIFENSKTNEHGNPVPCEGHDMKSVQLFAYSKDGIKLEKDNEVVILPPDNIMHNEFRDPKLYNIDGTYYFVVVARNESEGTGIIIYKSDDLKQWEVDKTYFTKEQGLMWECPDYFKLDGQEILMYSIIDSPFGDSEVVGYANCETKEEVNIEEFKRLDYGQKFYAPQTFEDHKGRRIVIGWLRMEKPIEDESWTGMMSLPRELSLKDGVIHQSPVLELYDYVRKESQISIENTNYYSESYDEKVCIDINLNQCRKLNEIKIKIGMKNKISIKYNGNKCFITTVLDGFERKYTFDVLDDKVELIKDRHVIECYIDNGKYVISDIYMDNVESYNLFVEVNNHQPYNEGIISVLNIDK